MKKGKNSRKVDDISAYIDEYAQTNLILDQLDTHQFIHNKTLPQAVEQLEIEMITSALYGNNRTQAAKELGISRELLYYKIRKYSIKVDK